MLLRVGHHAVTERRKTGTASGLVEVESHDFNRGSVSIHLRKNLQSYNKKTIKKDFPQFKKLHNETKERLQNNHEWLPASVGF